MLICEIELLYRPMRSATLLGCIFIDFMTFLILCSHPVLDGVPWKQSLRQGFRCVLLVKEAFRRKRKGHEGSRAGGGKESIKGLFQLESNFRRAHRFLREDLLVK